MRRGLTLVVLVVVALLGGPKAARADFLIQGLDGPVTPQEIASFEAGMASATPGTSNHGNNYVYGNGGKGIEALGEMYQVSGDAVVLDKMIQFTDGMLAARNDLGERRMIWTGRAELCWPNKDASAADGGYCGTENGDVVGHIAFCAQMILDTPVLWNVRVPDGDPHHFGGTYLERAKRYVKEGDRVVDEFILPRMVDATTKRFHVPTGAGYAALGVRYAKDAGHGAPWNQQAMLGAAFVRLAACHERLADDAARVKRYDAVVKAAAAWFVSELHGYKTAGGKGVYKWSYATGDASLHYMEDAGHGGYDVLGIVRARQRSAAKVSTKVLRQLAASVRYVMAGGTDGKFSGRVDGGGGRKAALGSTYLLLAQYDPNLFPLLANAALLKQAKTRMDIAARVLWMKDFRSHGFVRQVELATEEHETEASETEASETEANETEASEREANETEAHETEAHETEANGAGEAEAGADAAGAADVEDRDDPDAL